MSQELIDHSPDLKKLQDEGYSVDVRDGYVLVKDIPYINEGKQCLYGTLVCPLCLAGYKAVRPSDHVMYFQGEQPCNADGSCISGIVHSNNRIDFGHGIIVDRSFSNKPSQGFNDYYEKFRSYINIIFGPVHLVDPSASPTPHRPIIETNKENSPFVYFDTNASRANIGVLTDKLRGLKIGIVGLGGTGAYLLDLIAKTPVHEIHLFDGDRFYTHNAFRAPGAASIDDLNALKFKTEYFKEIYFKMKHCVISHHENINEENINNLKAMSFVFLCMDSTEIKGRIVDELWKSSVPFIDTGIGLRIQQEKIAGSVRVTAVFNDTDEKCKSTIPLIDTEDDIYASNIQIAEINNLCAVLAVIKWKQFFGVYSEQERYDSINYDISMGDIVSDFKKN